MNKTNKKALPTIGAHAIFEAASQMTPEIVVVGDMKKRGYKLRKTEGDVARLAAAVQKRERRAERNQRIAGGAKA